MRLTLVLSIGLLSITDSPEWAAAEEPTTASQRAAMTAIEELGGRARPGRSGKFVVIDLQQSRLSEADLQLLNEFPDLETLSLSYSTVTDDALSVHNLFLMSFSVSSAA